MDREKVIKAFEICDNNEDGIVCKNCPYKEDKWNGAWEDETGKTCFQTLHADVLALLKEQDELLRKKHKDIDRLCAEISEWKHKYYDRPLKEQEAIEPVKIPWLHSDGSVSEKYRCGSCDLSIFPSYKFCPFCGQAVKWG